MDVGTEFSHYRVIEHVGRGGMADVWSAHDTRLGRTVAVKTIARNLALSTDPVALFEQEAITIAALEHPHILPIYEFGDISGQLYIVMRYVSGGALDKLVQGGSLPLNEVLRLSRAMAQALEYAHNNKVVHLDLKPSNILLDSNQSPYLADFGLAAVMGPEGRAQNPGSGTLLYMAPEQLISDDLDHRADIYSFCVLFYHLLTGQLPFDALAPLSLKQLQESENLPSVSSTGAEYPAELDRVLLRGTSFEPEARPNSIMTMFEEIEAVLQPRIATTTSSHRIVDYAASEAELGDLITSEQQDRQARHEAEDIYTRARRAWANGQGRFLLGVTHFMLVNDYYMQAEKHNLALDEAGRQMLLRGALEYDHEIDYWWRQLDNDSRRWVTLHAVRSENVPARVRALERLKLLPDTDMAAIPRQIGRLLQTEGDESVLLAALDALEARAGMMSEKPKVAAPATAGIDAHSSPLAAALSNLRTSPYREVVEMSAVESEEVPEDIEKEGDETDSKPSISVNVSIDEMLVTSGVDDISSAALKSDFVDSDEWMKTAEPDDFLTDALQSRPTDEDMRTTHVQDLPAASFESAPVVPEDDSTTSDADAPPTVRLDDVAANTATAAFQQPAAGANATEPLDDMPPLPPDDLPTEPFSSPAPKIEQDKEDKLRTATVGDLPTPTAPDPVPAQPSIEAPQIAAPRSEMMSRLSTRLQLTPENVWKDVIFSHEVDLLLAQLALTAPFASVRESAARTIGRINSLLAVREIAQKQRDGVRGALRALAFVRDEAPSLPPEVSDQARLYAYLANTWRRATEDPMRIVWRFLFALLGGFLAIGLNTYITYRAEAIFAPARLRNGIAVGLTFGVMIAILVILADEVPSRLRGFWLWWMRLLLSGVLGLLFGTLVWAGYDYMFLEFVPVVTSPLFAGAGLALGFILTTMLNLRGWLAFLVTAVLTYIPLYLTFSALAYGTTFTTIEPVLYYSFETPEQIYTLGAMVAILIALGGHAPALIRDIRGLLGRRK